MAGFGAIVSSGILLSVIGYGQPSLVTAGLYYLLGSTLALGAFMLLLELIERIRSPGAAVLALTMEVFTIEEAPDEPVGESIPAALAFLGLSFAGCALIIAGLPPLSGFVAKFGLFHALLNPGIAGSTPTYATWALMALILLSSLTATIALLRFGVRTFWSAGKISPPHLPFTEAAPICLLLLLSIVLTVQAGPVLAYLERTTEDLHRPQRYIDKVLSEPVIPGSLGKKEVQ